MEIRLNKFLSRAGVTSRRGADRLIREGRVRVNGKVVQELGVKVDEHRDRIDVDGKTVGIQREAVYVLLNKPPGFLVSMKDPFNRPTVFSLLSGLRDRVFPVGRLDFESEGLLLLTNDGELSNRLLHPRHQVEKVYRVTVEGRVDPAKLKKLEKGVVLNGKKTAPARLKRLRVAGEKTFLQFQIYEGRKREVRRMCERIGHRVLRLQRIQFAGLSLARLKPGEWRHLRPFEVDQLKKKVGL